MKQSGFTGIEMRFGSHRGIEVKGGCAGSGVTYRFDTDPHTIGRYRSNQVNLLYEKALTKFIKCLEPPDQFTFEAYEKEFTATKIDQ